MSALAQPEAEGRPEAALAIELVGISKSFGPVQANKDIHLAVRRGTIHGIVGENGAGKSTLMSILYGFYTADAGEIRIDGQPTVIHDSLAAIKAGIGMVHQHFMLVEPFTVLENIILGAEDGRLLRPSLDKARAELTRLEEEYELEVDPDAVVGELSVGLQQRVEILKALYRECDILILDEPTGVLTPAEADHLFRILGHLKEQGKTIILITHKLREIMAITDDVSVMRRGEMVRTLRTAETSPAELAELMVGRRVLLRVEKTEADPGDVVLEVKDLTLTDEKGVVRLKAVSFSVREGEILGIAGVAGNGQSELLEVLAGMRPATGGQVRYRGEPVDLARSTNADDRRIAGIAHVPEDRHRRGLVMPFAEWENSCFGYHFEPRFDGPFATMNRDAVRDLAREGIERFDIRPPSCDLKTANFSGGNQQKIVLAREIERDPDVLLVGQPTRGVDIGAIEFIHQQIVALRDRRKAIVLVSVELDEIQALSDRIVVMFDGRISGERVAGETDERELGLLMAGIDPGKGARGMKATLPRWADLALIPALNLLLAFLVAGLVVIFIGENPVRAMRILVTGSLGSSYGIGFTLYYATTFVFTGLAFAIAFHAGLFNIGAEGQAALGGIGATLVCLAFDWPHWLIALPFAILGAGLFGAAWAFIPGYLQAKRGSHVVITTIMFNFIASALVVYLLVNVLKVPGSMAPETRNFAEGTFLPFIHEMLGAIGIPMSKTPMNFTAILALVAAFLTWLLIWRTRLGYEMRAFGHSEPAAVYAGIDPVRITVIAMLLSGAMAGMMALNVVMGFQHRLVLDYVGGAGFVGIAVALMGRSHPVGVLLASVLFGILYQGGAELAFEMPAISREMIVVIQALVILFTGALENLVRGPVERAFLRLRERAA